MVTKDHNNMIENFIKKIERKQIKGSLEAALETLVLLRHVVSVSKFGDVSLLIEFIHSIGQRLVKIKPPEFAALNLIQRTLHIIREEFEGLKLDNKVETEENVSLIQSVLIEKSPKPNILYNLKPIIIQNIQDMIDEVVNGYTSIASQAKEHIHSSEVILTSGKSKTIEEFLKFASKKRTFQCVVVETNDKKESLEFTTRLAESNIECTLITFANVYSVMARMNKVILGTHAVMANGGLIASIGAQTVAMAAFHHNVPVVVCAGMYKLSPMFPTDQNMNCLISPCNYKEYQNLGNGTNKPDLISAYFDYVPPEYVTLYITNHGGHSPSYLYRLINENYNAEDAFHDSDENEYIIHYAPYHTVMVSR